MKRLRLAGLILMTCLQEQAGAYETPTHYELSRSAFEWSEMLQDGALENLGLRSANLKQDFPTTPLAYKGEDAKEFKLAKPACAHGNRETLLRLVACGAMFEDAPGTRSLNHFMDTAYDGTGLSVMPVALSSAEWALQDVAAKTERQEFSYWSARNYFYAALTTTGVANAINGRNELWGKTFQSLGQVVHHVQDMTQPQHVRDEPHLDAQIGVRDVGSFHPSRYEKYSAFDDGAVQIQRMLDKESFDPVYPRLKDRLISPRAFWTGDVGVANYTNTNFLSARTNFTAASTGTPRPDSKYLQPSPSDAGEHVSISQAFGDEPVPAVVQTFCATVGAGKCYMTFYPTVVEDNETGEKSTNQKASTESLFDEDLNGFVLAYERNGRPITSARVFTLNRLNFNAAYPYLIKKAVQYSAGLINYFFRGKLEVALPSAGVYAVVDHATENCKDSCGFRTLKLKVTNRTPAEAMSNGEFVAVVKFRRDTCYQPSLDNPNIPLTCRSPEEEIVVSRPIPVTDPFESEQGRELGATFDTPIPINATDVFLQVVFRGTLGTEPNAVAVGTRDISEPTYVATFNDTDYVALANGCYTPERIVAQDQLWNMLAPVCRDSTGPNRKVSDACANLPLNFKYVGGTAGQPVSISTVTDGSGDHRIPSKRFARFAVLADRDAPVTYRMVFNNPPLYLPDDLAATNLSTYTLGEALDGTLSVGAMNLHRGVASMDAVVIVIDGTTGTPSNSCPEAQFEALGSNERMPVPSAIAGW